MIGITSILAVWLVSILAAYAYLDWPIIAADWAYLRKWWAGSQTVKPPPNNLLSWRRDPVQIAAFEALVDEEMMHEADHPIFDPIPYDLRKVIHPSPVQVDDMQ